MSIVKNKKNFQMYSSKKMIHTTIMTGEFYKQKKYRQDERGIAIFFPSYNITRNHSMESEA